MKFIWGLTQESTVFALHLNTDYKNMCTYLEQETVYS